MAELARSSSPSGASLVARRKLVICGSMAFFGEMCRLQDTLAARGVRSALPDVEDDQVACMASHQYEAFKRAVSFAHLRRIKNPNTFGILAVNFDRHGIANYIGPSTFAEIAVAAVSGKRVFVLNEYPSVYAEELGAWNVTPLNGRLDLLVEGYCDACALPSAQLNMFYAA